MFSTYIIYICIMSIYLYMGNDTKDGDIMIFIKSLKDYIGKDNFDSIVKYIYDITKDSLDIYKDYHDWYYEKMINGINTPKRNILLAINNGDIVGIIFLKKDIDEKKVCTIYVKKDFRKLGIGSILMEEGLKWLDTDKPLVTVADDRLEEFLPLVRKYKFNLDRIIPNLYRLGHNEYIFNENTNILVRKKCQ